MSPLEIKFACICLIKEFSYCLECMCDIFRPDHRQLQRIILQALWGKAAPPHQAQYTANVIQSAKGVVVKDSDTPGLACSLYAYIPRPQTCIPCRRLWAELSVGSFAERPSYAGRRKKLEEPFPYFDLVFHFYSLSLMVQPIPESIKLSELCVFQRKIMVSSMGRGPPRLRWFTRPSAGMPFLGKMERESELLPLVLHCCSDRPSRWLKAAPASGTSAFFQLSWALEASPFMLKKATFKSSFKF